MPSFEKALAAKALSESDPSPPPEGAVTNPFADMDIVDYSFLDSVSDRSVCPLCSKRRKFFCYGCYCSMPDIASKVPSVSLPIKLHVVKHPKEVEGKSTAVHAAVIASADTTVHTWPDIPNFDVAKTLLVFPGDSSVTLKQLAKEMDQRERSSTTASQPDVGGPANDVDERKEPPRKKARLRSLLPYDAVVVIESTWNQAHSIFIDERLQKLQRIQLEDYETHFWRYQRGKPTSYLSTIEAIYWFFVEFDRHFPDADSALVSPRRFDNLLFFFSYMHSKIFKMYDGRLKVTEERRQRLADRQKEEAKAKKRAEEEEEEEKGKVEDLKQSGAGEKEIQRAESNAASEANEYH